MSMLQDSGSFAISQQPDEIRLIKQFLPAALNMIF